MTIIPAPQPQPLTPQQLSLLRFQRYLTATYPLTSAMSYAIGIYVLENIIAPK